MARKSRRPRRQLLWLLIDDLAQRNGPFDTVLDLACGPMQMAGHIPAARYIGVDMDESKLKKGLKRHPTAKGVVSSIQDLEPSVHGDLVICVQCIGVNELFDPNDTMACVSKMVGATNPGGHLFVNVGGKSKRWYGDVEAKLREAFEKVQVVRYGRFKRPLPRMISYALARLMLLVPPLARRGSGKLAFVCEHRLA